MKDKYGNRNVSSLIFVIHDEFYVRVPYFDGAMCQERFLYMFMLSCSKVCVLCSM